MSGRAKLKSTTNTDVYAMAVQPSFVGKSTTTFLSNIIYVCTVRVILYLDYQSHTRQTRQVLREALNWTVLIKRTDLIEKMTVFSFTVTHNLFYTKINGKHFDIDYGISRPATAQCGRYHNHFGKIATTHVNIVCSIFRL